jgi:excisionase family DNA binding protein
MVKAAENTAGPAMSAGLIDAAQAGELLGVPKTWVLAEARADRIPHVRLGRYVRFEPKELEQWWEARRRGPQAKRAKAV